MGAKIDVGATRGVIAFLKAQHEHIKGLFAKVLRASGNDRELAFYELRQLMAVHEAAEEEIVHPAASHVLSLGAGSVVASRLKEESEAKIALVELERLDLASPEFETKLIALQRAVLAHAAIEEREEFARLGDCIDLKGLQRMRKASTIPELILPTHPGRPFTSMLDRARDALSIKS